MSEERPRHIDTAKACQPGGPYAQAVCYNGLVYLSGCGAIDPRTNRLKPGTIEEEAELTLENIRIILDEAGSAWDRIIKVTVFLLDIREYGRFNDVYWRWFPEKQPARTCLQAGGLPFGLRVEMDVIAAL